MQWPVRGDSPQCWNYSLTNRVDSVKDSLCICLLCYNRALWDRDEVPVHLLSPSTLFFVFFFCTSYCFFAHLVVFLHISLSFAHLIVFCTSYCFLHILLFCTFLFHCTFYSYFSFSYHMYALVLCYLYNLYSYCFALSTERTWFDCISLLVMPCITIMWQIKKPWPWPWTEMSADKKGSAAHTLPCLAGSSPCLLFC